MSIFSEQINEITKALSKVQSSLKHASKDSNNPYFKSKYADLAEVWQTCQSLLAENNLAVSQALDIVDGKQALTTILSHSSGQWIKSTGILPICKPGPQEVGSCITYFRRYSLAALVGIYQDDDDGEAAQQQFRKPASNKISPMPVEEKAPALTRSQQEELTELVEKINKGDLKKLEERLGCDSIYDIHPKEFDRVVRSIKTKIAGGYNAQ